MINKNTRDISHEIIKVPYGETYFEKSYNYNDRIVEITFTEANEETEIDIPLPDQVAPSSFEVLSSGGGNIYADSDTMDKWLPHKIFLKSTIAGNTAKIRIKY